MKEDRLLKKAFDDIANKYKWKNAKFYLKSDTSDTYAMTSEHLLCRCLYLDEAGKNREETLFIKREIKKQASIYFYLQFYENEVEFYKWTCSHKVPIEIPKCYYAECDSNNQEMIIVMNKYDEYKIINQVEGISKNELIKIVQQICNFHNYYFKEKNVFSCRELPDDIVNFYKDDFENSYKVCLSEFFEFLPNNLSQLYNKIIQNFELIFMKINHGPQSLIHFDLRLDNFLFYSDNSVLALLDWQMVRKGNVTWDLVILVIGNLNELSIENVKEILMNYYSMSFLKDKYTYDQFIEDFKYALIYQIIREICYLGDDSYKIEARILYASKVTVRYSSIFEKLIDLKLFE